MARIDHLERLTQPVAGGLGQVRSDSRTRYRAELQVDDASWLRGRGWALFQAVMALPYYWDTNPGMIRQASHALTQVLADRTS